VRTKIKAGIQTGTEIKPMPPDGESCCGKENRMEQDLRVVNKNLQPERTRPPRPTEISGKDLDSALDNAAGDCSQEIDLLTGEQDKVSTVQRSRDLNVIEREQTAQDNV
jgi:hypothetical protein